MKKRVPDGDDEGSDLQQQLVEIATSGGVKTNLAGKAITKILKQDPARKKETFKLLVSMIYFTFYHSQKNCIESFFYISFFGEVAYRQYSSSIAKTSVPMPASMRQSIWTDYLVSRDPTSNKVTSGDQTIDQELHKNFVNHLAKKVKEQKLPRASRSKNGSAIDTSVIETYDNCQVLKPLDIDDYTMRSARVLNTFDVYTQAFNPVHVYWLVPLQCVYTQKREEEDGLYTVRLAHLLTQATAVLCPKQEILFALADKVIAIFKEQDNVYYGHMKESLSQQTSKIDVKQFPPEVLHKTKSTSDAMYAELVHAYALSDAQAKPFLDPAIYIRKWIAQVNVIYFSKTSNNETHINSVN